MLVHYDEIALKGRNRRWFVDLLVRHLRSQTRGLGVHEVRAFKGRVELVLTPGADLTAVEARVACTFGVATFGRAVRCAARIEDVLQAVPGLLAGQAPVPFRVTARRADKRFVMTSPEIEQRVGALIHERLGWPVDLVSPRLVVSVEVVQGAIFCSASRTPGAGGLPSGSSGRALALLSGGLDSPVAAWRVMRRGCRLDAVHFHSQPLTSASALDHLRRTARRLARFQGSLPLALVNLLDVQKRLAVVAPESLRTLLYRRSMVRLAAGLARRHGAEALVTGDVIGQVASQTPANLVAVDQASPLPVWRPLLGHDKREILAAATAIGVPRSGRVSSDDCCLVFAPMHGATRAPLARLEALEAAACVQEAEAHALEVASWEILEPDWAMPGPAQTAQY